MTVPALDRGQDSEPFGVPRVLGYDRLAEANGDQVQSDVDYQNEPHFCAHS